MNKAIFIAFMLLFAIAVQAEEKTSPAPADTNAADAKSTTPAPADDAKTTTPAPADDAKTTTPAPADDAKSTTPSDDAKTTTPAPSDEDVEDKCFKLAHGKNVQEFLNTCKDTANACGADIKKMCLTPKSHEFSTMPIMRCMKHNWSKVSTSCKDFVVKKMEARFQKKMPTCYKETESMCKDTTGFMRFRCIKQHHDDLSEACKTEMKNAMMKRLGKCAADYTKFCANVRPGHRRVKACLRRNRHRLSPDCQEQMCSPIFGKCCQDIRKHCQKMAKLGPGHKQDDDDEFEDSVKPVDAPVKFGRHHKWGHHGKHGKHGSKGPHHGPRGHGPPRHGRHGRHGPRHQRPSPAQLFHQRHQFVMRCLADNLSKLSAGCVAQQKAQDGHFELPGAIQEEQNDHENDENVITDPMPDYEHHHNIVGGIFGILIVMGIISSLIFCMCRCIRRARKGCCKKGGRCGFPGNQQYSQLPSDNIDVEMQPVHTATATPVTAATTTTVTAVPVSKASVPVATVTAVPAHSQMANNVHGATMTAPTMVVGQYYPVMNGQQQPQPQQYAGAQPVVYRQ